MAQLNDFSKIIHNGSEISKIMSGDVEVWSSGYEWAEDSDFEFVTSTARGTYLYNGKKGYFKYIGTKEYVAIPDTIKGVQMTSYYSLFKESPASLKGVYSDNSNVTDMNNMFRNSSATTLDLSNFDTSSVTDMGYMFYKSKATTLDLSNFDTSSVTDMGYMFYDSKATALDLSNFDTSNVTNMSNMFQSSSATALDLSSFDTSNVTDMSYMFYKSKATTLDLSNFDTSNVTTMSYMFSGTSATTGYARTQADADRFNASSNKPSTLTFVVKP